MSAPSRIICSALVFGGLLGGCASTSADGSFQEVASAVEVRTGNKIYWNQGTEQDTKVAAAVRAMLRKELTLPNAVQIALINNRMLQAEYEELSIAQADLVQAGLLANPTFSGSLKFPTSGGDPPDIGLGVELDFLGLLFIPARKQLAGAQLEQVKWRLGDAVLAHAAEVRATYYRLQGAQQSVAMLRVITGAAQTAADLAARQNDAGNISDLDRANEETLYEQARLDLASAEAEILEHREELNRLMGVWGNDTGWKVPDKLPEIPAGDPSLDQLESLAMTQRLDVAAARQELQVASTASSLAGSSRVFGMLDVGVEAEREGEDGWEVGPSAKLTLPIFDQGQGMVARAEAQLRQSHHRLAGLAVNVRAEVRAARNRLVAARSVAHHYRTVLIPLRERVVALSQEQYDAMLIGVYQLLQVKQNEIETYRQYIGAVRDYWIARSNLERAVGGRLKAAPAPRKTQQSAATPPAQAPAGSPAAAPPPHHQH